MHRTGHWLGLDVHDVGDYKVGDEWRVFEPGMALTVEPGIYIPAGTRGVPKKFCNIGIRIEDDVVVTRGGCEVLTADVPTDPDAIEALMAGAHEAPTLPRPTPPSTSPSSAAAWSARAWRWRWRRPGIRVLLIEAVPPDSATQPSFDERTTALGNGSRRIFETLGVWPHMRAAVTPIRASTSPMPAASAPRGSRRASSSSRPSATSCRTALIGAALWRALQTRASHASRGRARAEREARCRRRRGSSSCDAAGDVERVDARLVVAADGAQSLVRAAAGIGAEVQD